MSASPRRTVAALVLSGAAVAAACWAAFRPPAAPPPPPVGDEVDQQPIPVRPDTEPYNPYQFLYTTEQSIAVYAERITRDPEDYASRTTLGTLHLRRAKETGDHGGYDRADELFAAALKLLPSYDPARVGRAAVANARHQFADGRKQAEAVYAANPDGPTALDALVLVFDANLELGRYEDADANLKELVKKAGDPTPSAFLARQARVVELRGDPDRAIRLLKEAADRDRADEASKVALAWYAGRIGEIELSQGKLDAAAASVAAARRDNPASADLKVLDAKVRLAQGRAAEAVAILDELLKVDRELDSFLAKVRGATGAAAGLETTFRTHQNVDTILLLGDALAAAGDRGRAEAQYRLADEKADREEPVAVRALILHACDTGRRLPRALALAEREAKARNDVFTCDSLAWALFKAGKLPEAERVAAAALRLGTRDAAVLFHAGAIAHKSGKKDRAKELLGQAVRANPHFSQIMEARRLLAE